MTKSVNIKKIIAFAVSVCLICVLFAGFVMKNSSSEQAFASAGEQIIKLQIGNLNMTVNEDTVEIDPGQGTVPVIIMNRLSVDCGCDGNPAEPDMHDIGILA